MYVGNTYTSAQALPNDLTAIINSFADGILITDITDKIIMVNKSSVLLMDNDYEEILGKNLITLVENGIFDSPEPNKFKNLAANIKSGQTTNFVLKLRNKTQLFNITGRPFYEQNTKKVNHIVYTSNDSVFQSYENYFKFNGSDKRGRDRSKTETDDNIEVFSYSDKMKPLLELIRKVAVVDTPVFLTGESGVGKGVIAKYIHNLGRRSDYPFIQINCAALPEALFESEVFGYEQGAFTGASRQGRQGLMELAGEGTLFLDEIGELSPTLQAKLLQVLQEKLFRRVGSNTPVYLKARVISATNQNIEELIRQKQFREDLYYRLCVVPVEIPPLREHWEDVMPLAELFINKFNKQYGTNRYFNSDVRLWMHHYYWPGNIRELQNVVEQLAISSEIDEIQLTDIPLSLQKKTGNLDELINKKLSLKEATEKMERVLIEKVLNESKNSREAANILGVSQSTLLRKVHKYKLQWWESI